LTWYIPYSVREIREMRRQGIIKGYKDLRKGKQRWIFNLNEISQLIKAGSEVPPKGTVQFNRDEIIVNP